MSLKESIENNALVILVAASVTVAGVTFAVADFFYNQKVSGLNQSFDLKLSKIESQLASIKRGLPGIEHYDIRNLFLSENDVHGLDSSLTYFKDDKFYSIKSGKYWEYNKTNELELMKSITGKKYDTGFFKIIRKQLERYPIHLWKGSQVIVVDDQGEIYNLFPHIVLQKLSHKSMIEAMGLGAKYADWLSDDNDVNFDEDDLERTSDGNERITSLDKAFYNDAAGVFFLSQNLINFQIAVNSPNKIFRVKKIQKLGPILYSQFITEYTDVVVLGEETSVYLRQEMMIVSKNEYIYFIKIVLPSLEPEARESEYANINTWLSSVKFAK